MTERRVAVKVDADVSPFVRGLTTAGAAAKGFAAELESADSRFSSLVQTGLALAPALVPLGAAAVPAIAGLTTQLGFAVGAAGTAVLAFQGVGDALKALNAYQIAPTQEHFAKLQQTMDALGPAGQEFVLALQDMRPQFQKLQDIAQQGMFPGLTDALNEVITLGPEAERVIGAISSTMGNLAREGAHALTGPSFAGFIEFLDREAAPTLEAMGKTLGNVVLGLTRLVMDFSPLSDDFTNGMLRMSQAFADWAGNLDSTQGFQNFVAYVRESGPQALDTLGALADALISFVRAAAPVGQVVLPIIADLAHALSAIADSPVGPVLITAAAGVGALGRALAVLKAVGLRGNGESVVAKAIGANEMKAALPSLRDAGTVLYRFGQSASQASAETLKARESVRSFARTAAPAAAAVAGMALATSGFAEKTGYSNTASLALMGTLAGPWGAAVGGAVGLLQDATAGNKELSASISNVNAQAKSLNLTAFSSALDDLSSKAQHLADLQNSISLNDFTPSGTLNNYATLWGGDQASKASEALGKAQAQFSDMLVALGRVDDAVSGVTFWDKIRQGAELSTPSLQSYQATLDSVSTAFAAAGKSSQDVIDFLQSPPDSAGFRAGVQIVQDYTAGLDGAAGQSKAVGAAMADLASQMESNVTQADALKNALDALFGVQLSQSAATDAAVVALRDMQGAVAKAGRGLLSNSDAALKARDGIRGYVSAQLDKVKADAAAGVSGSKLATTLLDTRNNIIATARAAGMGEKGIRELVKSMGLTPKNLQTIIETPGLLTAKQEIQALGKLYGLTPKQVRTLISQPGIGDSQKQIDALAKKYDMTPKEVRTFLRAIDQASGPIAAVRARLDALNGQVANTTIRTNHYDFYTGGAPNRSPGKPSADGSTVPKDSGPYGDRYPYLLAPGEEVISNRYGQADRHRALLKAINAGRLADGGTVYRGLAGGGTVKGDPAIAKLTEEIHGLRIDLGKSGKDALTGHDRRMKEIDLRQKEQDLRDKHQKAREDRLNALRDKLTGLRGAVSGFHPVQDTPGWAPRNPILSAIAGDIGDFRKSIHDAGGEWTKQLQHQAARLRKDALSIDVHERALTRETTKRDALTETLSTQQQALDELTQTMSAYSQSVAGNFLTTPFGLSHTVTTPGVVDAGTQSALDSAKARLAAIRNSPTGDSVAAAAEASKLIPQIASLQASVDQMSQPVETTVSGLDAMREQLQQNTKDALAFADALKTLSADGLNSDAFQQIAASGDLTTAQQLAAGGQSAVDDINALWNQRAEAAAQVAAYATQQVYGAQQAILEAKLAQTNAQLAQAVSNVKALQGEVKAVSNHVDTLGDRMVSAIQRQEAVIAGAIRDVPRQQAENAKKGKH